MRDLTALLMGDPGTQPRRAPTEAEKARWQQLGATRIDPGQGRGWSELRQWKIGEVRTFQTLREAKAKVSGLYVKGMCGSIRTKGDGTYTVTRMH